MTVEYNESTFSSKMIAEYEKIAEEKMITVSDNSQILVLHTKAQGKDKSKFKLVVIPGWGSIVLGWDEFLMKAKDYFDIYYLETREKKSSKLAKKSKCTLDRMSSDLKEVPEILKLNPKETVFFSSSFGAVLNADALNKKKVDPFLTILVGPMSKIDMPFPFRYLLYIVPSFLYHPFAPIGRFWVKKYKSEDEVQAAKYYRVMEEADPKKWKKFLTRFAFKKFWDTYAGIESRVLVIDESEDKLHRTIVTNKIASLIKNSEIVDLKTNKFTHSAGIADFINNKLSEH